MPYITKDLRIELDPAIDSLIESVKSVLVEYTADNPKKNPINGVANYVITRTILGMLEPARGWNYESLSDVDKTLNCSRMEIYRRLTAYYEDDKVWENGDLKEFEKDLEDDPTGGVFQEDIKDNTLLDAIDKNPITGP